MLESLVGRPRINKVGKRELMDISEPLKRERVDHSHFVVVVVDEDVDRIANLVSSLRQRSS